MCICVGILWNLSSKDTLKEKLARETLPELTDKILIPLSGSGDTESIQQTPSETDIFYNTTGCLRYHTGSTTHTHTPFCSVFSTFHRSLPFLRCCKLAFVTMSYVHSVASSCTLLTPGT